MSISIEQRAHDIAMHSTKRRFSDNFVAPETFTSAYIKDYNVAYNMLSKASSK